jgi:hypothetical protein
MLLAIPNSFDKDVNILFTKIPERNVLPCLKSPLLLSLRNVNASFNVGISALLFQKMVVERLEQFQIEGFNFMFTY